MLAQIMNLFILAGCSTLFIGCGSSDNTDSSSNTTGIQVTTQTVCDLVKQAEAESYLEKALTETPEASEKTGFPNYVSCIYTTSNSSGMGIRYLQVMIYQSTGTFDAAAFYENAKQGNEQAPPEDFEQIQDLGESAYIANGSLHVLTKGRYVNLGVGSIGEFKRDKTIDLAKLVLPRLP